MGLLAGLVLSLDRRAVLAVAGVAVSVAYTLVAASVVGGLKDSQSALAAGLQDNDLIGVGPDGGTVDVARLPRAPDHQIFVVSAGGRTFYVDSGAEALTPGNATAGPSAGLRNGESVVVGDRTLRVVARETSPGASPAWIRIGSQDWEGLAGRSLGQPHVVVYTSHDDALRRGLGAAGLEAAAAPATLDYYAKGADQLTAAVSTTVFASTAVIFLLTATFLHLDLQARRRSFATLRLFGGPAYVRRLMAGRGAFVLGVAHAMALLATLALLRLLDRADAVNLELPWARALASLAITLGGGVAAITVVVVRMPARLRATELTVARPPDVPVGLRPVLVSWRAAIPVMVAALVCAASLGVALGVSDVPFQIFGNRGAEVVAATSGNPLRGEVDAFMGLHMRNVEDFLGASPEIFAPTVIQGRPFMVRGIDWASLVSLDDVRLASGHPPQGFGEVLLGRHAARELGASVGARLLVPAAYTTYVLQATVVGIADSEGILADAVMVDLPTARALTGIQADSANIIRYRIDPEFFRETGRDVTLPTGIEVTDLRLNPPRPVSGQDAIVEVRIVNFDQLGRTRVLTLSVNGVPMDDLAASLPGRSEGSVNMTFRVPDVPRLEIRVNPHLSAEAAPRAYNVTAPARAALGSEVVVRVVELSGSPAAGVTVSSDEQSAVTDGTGTARLAMPTPGNRTLLAEGPAGRGAAYVLVLRPGDENASRLDWLDLNGPTETIEGPWTATATIQNLGGATFDGLLPVPINGTTITSGAVRVEPGARTRVEITLDLKEGRHFIGPPSAQLTVHVRVPGAGSSGGGTDEEESPEGLTVEDLLELRRVRGRPREAPADPVAAFLGDTYENFNAALTVVVLATILHSGLVLVAAVQREIEERTPRIGTLLAVGAHRVALRDRIVREYATVGGIGAALGTLAGIGLASVAAELGFLKGFGHALAPRASAIFALSVWFVNVVVLVATALLAGERVRERTVRSLLQEGPARAQRPPLDELLGGA